MGASMLVCPQNNSSTTFPCLETEFLSTSFESNQQQTIHQSSIYLPVNHCNHLLVNNIPQENSRNHGRNLFISFVSNK